MDYVLCNPNNRIISQYAGFEPPLWCGLIASDLRKRGKSVAIVDAEVLDLDLDETVEHISEYKPQEVIVVVMGQTPSVSSTPKMPVASALVERLKGKYKVSITGLHPSALPEETERELGIPVLKGKIFDGTPDMPWELFDMGKYVAHGWHCLDGSPRQPYAVVYTSLNCPHSCEFCNVKAQYGFQRKVWQKPVDEVLKEIDTLVQRYHVRNIKFYDELFVMDTPRVNEILDSLIERRYDLNIWAYARVDTINERLLDKLWNAGVNWLGVGFESGSNLVLEKVNKNATRLQAIKAVRRIHDAGIYVMGNFIFGLPGDNATTMKETLEFAKSLEVDFANMYVASALPGSAIFQKQEGDWGSYGQFAKNQEITKAKKFRDKAFNNFFTDEDYLNRVRGNFGQQAVDSINDMIAKGKPITRGVEYERPEVVLSQR